MTDPVPEERREVMTPERAAVAAVAYALSVEAERRRRWWQRRATIFDFIPPARIAVGQLIAEGWVPRG